MFNNEQGSILRARRRFMAHLATAQRARLKSGKVIEPGEARQQEILNRITGVVTSFGVSHTAVERQTTLCDIGFDSLLTLEFFLRVEEEFGVSIGDETVERLRTIGDLIGYLADQECREPLWYQYPNGWPFKTQRLGRQCISA
ncbi:MAG: Acyl carrier protein [bacterium ADurb.Bin400]|nr:MAG: Acyl carrier protein [bacterium ADurb.Bin400]